MVPERPALPGHTPPDFVPPGVDEVRRFCQQRKINVDAQRFVNYYASIGWQVGQLPMRDWKAALLNWHAKDEKLEKEKKNGNTAAQTDLSLARRIGAVL